uniref:Uncharacterized protein n=1 Tax=Echeneis naucrates TaxID=173247 RepID=A0A665VGA8_ECHNA
HYSQQTHLAEMQPNEVAGGPCVCVCMCVRERERDKNREKVMNENKFLAHATTRCNVVTQHIKKLLRDNDSHIADELSQ